MQTVSIAGTKLTPSVTLNSKKGWLEIEGSSITDNASEFYKLVIESVDKYILKPAPKTVIDIKLQYITMPSSKCILEILKKFEFIHKKETSQVVVNWNYSVDEMLNAGKDYQSIIKIPFNMIEV